MTETRPAVTLRAPLATGITPPRSDAKHPATLIRIQDLHFWYGGTEALKGITLDIPANQVTAFIGPSGCGKSTLLRCLNRMNDLIEGTRHEGAITLDKLDLYGADVDPVALRRHVGMVFQKPNPFPKSIYENVAYGVRLHRKMSRAELDAVVERALRQAHLWDEVKDRLGDAATGLSGGQQQRLCIARALAVEPKVLLMDEPCSALDPIATQKIEDLILELQHQVTIVIVTHNLQQAARISDRTAFFYLGSLIEEGATAQLFEKPSNPQTEAYVTGRFG